MMGSKHDFTLSLIDDSKRWAVGSPQYRAGLNRISSQSQLPRFIPVVNKSGKRGARVVRGR